MAETHKERVTRMRNGQKRVSTHTRRTARNELANSRKEKASKRTAEEQIARLDARLGKGVGAKKERKRLSQTAK